MKTIRVIRSISMWLLLFFAKNCNSCGNDFFKLEKSYSDKGFQLDCLKECKLTNSDLCQLKNCDIMNYQKVSEIQPSNCLSRDLLSFVKTNANIPTENVKILEFDLYLKKENERVVELSQDLFQYFPKLGKLYIKNANLTVSAKNIPRSLVNLTMYNSNQISLPESIPTLKKIRLEYCPNINDISEVRNYPNLESLQLKRLDSLRTLPANVFKSNSKLNFLRLDNLKITLHQNSLKGLKSLSKFQIYRVNFTKIPSGFFNNTPSLKEIFWDDDVCQNGKRIMPQDMLSGTKITKFSFKQKDQG